MSSPDPLAAPAELRSFIQGLLRQVGPRVAERLGTTGPLTFKRGHEAITPVDSEVERLLIGLIRERFPDHRVSGEEHGVSGALDSGWEWHLDPIDGTLNYSLGIPLFSVSVAVAREGRLLAGGVADPLRGEIFSAASGEGAFLGDLPIHTSRRSRLADAIVSTQFSSRSLFVGESSLLQALHVEPMKTRRLGSIALELAYVAAGRFDLLVAGKAVPQNLYDVAAGLLLVQEAGGRVSAADGAPFDSRSVELIASNGLLHDEVLGMLRPFLERRRSRPAP